MTMVSQKTMDRLRSIGLNLYERKLYVALLARGTSTAGELSEMAIVPRSRSYDVLESLAEKGFVVIKNAKPLQYVAVSPGEALERAKNKMRADLSEAVERIDELKTSDTLDELAKLHSSGVTLVDSADISGSLKGRHSIHQQVGTMLKSAQSSIDILTTETGLKELYDNHSELLKTAGEKGVKVRIAAPLTPKNKEAADAVRKYAAVKDTSAILQKMPTTRMFMIDGRESVLALTDDEKTHHTQDVAFWSASAHFSDRFVKPTFEMIWEKLNKPGAPQQE